MRLTDITLRNLPVPEKGTKIYVCDQPKGFGIRVSQAGTKAPWTLRDLRRTYATNLQRLDIKLEVTEALFNHVSGTRAGIVGVYQHHHNQEEMVEAVNIYERWLQSLIKQD